MNHWPHDKKNTLTVAAADGCNKYDERSGKATHVPMCEYYSRYGERTEVGYTC